ncbi:MAG: metallophosphoesterase family protein [Planctomycetota bacterium]|jgi:Icc-related predicted phosphoesterase
MQKPSEYLNILSLSWDEAVISFNLNEMAKIRVESSGKIIFETDEFSDIGYITLKTLTPATSYNLKIKWKRKSRILKFKTLPRPTGKQISSFAVFGDPHISEKNENRKGRLFVESEDILRSVAAEINEVKADFTLIAGDLTNRGTAGEYKAVTSILKTFKKPVLSAPGDHDIKGKGKTPLWKKHFGPLQWCRDIKGIRIVGINSARPVLDSEGHALISKALQQKRYFPIILSHHQLIDNPVINIGAKKKTVQESPERDDIVKLIKSKKSLFFAGHQNIASGVKIGKSLQVNVPQPAQYVCGYYLVRRYKNGFYHTLKPIKSAILQHYSREAGNRAALIYKERQWKEEYREGRGLIEANFLYRM